MTPAKAKVIFATHMQAARKRKLTGYELEQLGRARQVLRQSRKPAMNAKMEALQVGDRVYFSSDPEKIQGTVKAVHMSGIKVKWDDGELTVVRRPQIRKVLATPKGKLPNPKPVLIYGSVDRIYATKTQEHICDAECKRNGHRYFHNFKTHPKMYGLPDGSILLKS